MEEKTTALPQDGERAPEEDLPEKSAEKPDVTERQEPQPPAPDEAESEEAADGAAPETEEQTASETEAQTAPDAEEQTASETEAQTAPDAEEQTTSETEEKTAPETEEQRRDRLLHRRASRFPSADESPYDENHPRVIDAVFDFVELLVLTFTIVMLLFCFVFRHSIVDGNSMKQTLQDGDHLIISALAKPERGDIIVFEDYSIGIKKPLVKRVIAVAGDTVEIRVTGIYVNGKKLKEEYVYIDEDVRNWYVYEPMEEFTVPEGKLFVLGDHRNDSNDSRYLGCIDEDAVLGKVLIRIYPFSSFGKVE